MLIFVVYKVNGRGRPFLFEYALLSEATPVSPTKACDGVELRPIAQPSHHPSSRHLVGKARSASTAFKTAESVFIVRGAVSIYCHGQMMPNASL